MKGKETTGKLFNTIKIQSWQGSIYKQTQKLHPTAKI